MVVDLSEPHEANCVKKHVREDVAEFESEGIDPDETETLTKHRVLMATPNDYSAGTNKAADRDERDDQSDLADVFVQ